LNIMKLAGISTVFGLVGFMVISLRRERKYGAAAHSH
jgi:hypothetical protein